MKIENLNRDVVEKYFKRNFDNHIIGEFAIGKYTIEFYGYELVGIDINGKDFLKYPQYEEFADKADPAGYQIYPEKLINEIINEANRLLNM